MPACGVTADAMPNAMASGRATTPTVTPAMTSETNAWRSYVTRHSTSFGRHARQGLPLSSVFIPSERGQDSLHETEDARLSACSQAPDLVHETTVAFCAAAPR